jgi:hypothetical protein
MYINVVFAGGWAMGERAVGGGGGLKMEQLALRKGPARQGIRCHVQRAAIPSKRSFLFLLNKFMYALNIVTCNLCEFIIKKKNFSLGRLKTNHVTGN